MGSVVDAWQQFWSRSIEGIIDLPLEQARYDRFLVGSIPTPCTDGTRAKMRINPFICSTRGQFILIQPCSHYSPPPQAIYGNDIKYLIMSRPQPTVQTKTLRVKNTFMYIQRSMLMKKEKEKKETR